MNIVNKCLVWMVAAAALSAGCQSEQEVAAIHAQEARMSPAWVQANVIVGQTTRADVLRWYGPPMLKTTASSSGPAGAWLPDEVWTYSVRFSDRVGSFGSYDFVSRTRTVVFSFKGQTVANVTTGSVE